MNIADAIEQHAKAKRLAKQAEELAAEARQVIIDYYAGHPSAWKQVDPKTYELRAGEYKTSITLPTSAEIPAHFDQSRIDQFIAVMEDTGLNPEVYVTTKTTVTKTLDEIKLLQDMMQMEDKDRMHDLISPYIIPKQEPKPLAPRVSSE